MTFDHNRPTMAMMLRPGRRSRFLKEATTREISRITDREDEMTLLSTTSAKAFVRDLAEGHAKRLAERREKILRRQK